LLAIDDLPRTFRWVGADPDQVVAVMASNIDIPRAICRDSPRLLEGDAPVTVLEDLLGTKREPEDVVGANWSPQNSITNLPRDVQDAARQGETIGPRELDRLPVTADRRRGHDRATDDQGRAGLPVHVACTTSGVRDFEDLFLVG
jgi:hypothetical protein